MLHVHPSRVARRNLSMSLTPTTPSGPPPGTSSELPHSARLKISHGSLARLNGAPPRELNLSHANITRRLGIKFAATPLGAQEWRTSTYTFNRAATRNLPTASQVTDKLLTAYVALQRAGEKPSSRTAIQARKKGTEKMYVSGGTVKDFGGRVEVSAFIYDEGMAVQREAAKRAEARTTRTAGQGRRPGGPGGAAGGAAGGRTGGARGPSTGARPAFGARATPGARPYGAARSSAGTGGGSRFAAASRPSPRSTPFAPRPNAARPGQASRRDDNGSYPFDRPSRPTTSTLKPAGETTTKTTPAKPEAGSNTERSGGGAPSIGPGSLED
nr:hypothetical protein B0A51_14531 [Rachicladosporium sp. CCFEE 5018]